MRYTKSHEWVKVENGLATIGITKFAQKELGEVVFVQLPTVGTHLRALGEACVLESTKAAVDVYSPVSGQVVAVNEAAAQLINQDPEGQGWLFRVALSHVEELTQLLTPAEYQKSVQLRS